MHRAQPVHRQDPHQRRRDHGHVHQHDISLLHPLLAEHAGEGFDLVQELGVGDALLGGGDRAVVEDGGVVAAVGEDVAVEGIIAGGEAGGGEPGPVGVGDGGGGVWDGGGVQGEGGGGRGVPVEEGCLVGPEGGGVGEGEGLGEVLGVLGLALGLGGGFLGGGFGGHVGGH